MKKILAVLAVGLMLLGGCSTPEPPPEPQGTGSIREDAMTVNLHLGGEPSTIDPAYATADDGGSYVLHLFEGLTALDKDGKAAPAAAESWEVEEDDNGLPIYTFTLREGIVWSDGVPVTAEDFAYAWLRILDPAGSFPNAYQLYPIQNAQRYREGVLVPGEDGELTVEMSVEPEEVGVEVTEEGALQVTLEGPCPDFLELLASPAWCPVRQDVVEANPATWTQAAATCVTNGRYMLSQWNHDQNLLLARNDAHWDTAQGGAAFLNFVLSEDAEAVYNDFAAGRLQYASALPTLDREEEAAAGTFVQQPRAGLYYYIFNTAKSPFDDARVRQAVSLAIDRTDLTSEGVDLAPAYSLVPDGIADTQQKKDFSKVSPPISGGVTGNITTAQKLLSEAGYPGGAGFPQLRFITTDAPAHLEAAEKIRQMLADNLGIDMAISALSTTDFQTSRAGDGWDMARGGMVGYRTDPAPYLEGWSIGGGANYGSFSNEEYDRLVSYSRTAPESSDDLPEPEEAADAQEEPEGEDEDDEDVQPAPLRLTRMEALHAMDKLLVADQAAVVPLWQYREPALTARGLTGVVSTPLGYRLFSYARWTPPAAEEGEGN